MARFMPDHIKMLKEVQQDYYKTPRPQLDEGQIEDLERLLSESLQEETLLEIITWKNGFFMSRVGTISKIDRYAKKIKILDELDSEITLNFFNIIDVKVK